PHSCKAHTGAGAAMDEKTKRKKDDVPAVDIRRHSVSERLTMTFAILIVPLLILWAMWLDGSLGNIINGVFFTTWGPLLGALVIIGFFGGGVLLLISIWFFW
ncbi:MAG: hypothetical protein AAF125_20620, partial [Chloroflexota bacterium]